MEAIAEGRGEEEKPSRRAPQHHPGNTPVKQGAPSQEVAAPTPRRQEAGSSFTATKSPLGTQARGQLAGAPITLFSVSAGDTISTSGSQGLPRGIAVGPQVLPEGRRRAHGLGAHWHEPPTPKCTQVFQGDSRAEFTPRHVTIGRPTAQVAQGGRVL